MFLKLAKGICAVLLTVSLTVQADSTFAPPCASASSDSTGDGWGWENDRSCVVTDAMASPNRARLVCALGTVDSNGDGWEVQDGVSCLVVKPGTVSSAEPTAISAPTMALQVAPESTRTSTPSCQLRSSDPDGDGWGYENSTSCIIDSSSAGESLESAADTDVAVVITAPVSTRPICASASSDEDNDGWGYENGESCRVAASPVRETASVASTAVETISGKPVCASSLSDLDGDGYGFENNSSCVIAASSRPFPVCLSLHSDHDGNGFGFEGGASCITVEGISHSRFDPLYATPMCESWAEIAYGNYRIENNTWNARVMDNSNWSQCIRLDLIGNRPVASWTFDWLGMLDGKLEAVKSYPQVYYGRKTARSTSGSFDELGLPELVYNLPEFTVDYRWSMTGDAENNVALESFFHSSCEADHDNKEFEMMIWVGRPKTKSPGVYLTVATIDGKRWEIYANPWLDWGYISFVAEESTYSGRLNWNRFVEWSIDNATAYGINRLRTDTCMGAIEMGTETFWGKGEFTLHQFDVNYAR